MESSQVLYAGGPAVVGVGGGAQHQEQQGGDAPRSGRTGLLPRTLNKSC